MAALEEYELKIAFSDTLQDLLRGKTDFSQACDSLKSYLAQLLKLYKPQRELTLIKVHLKQMEGSEKTIQNDLSCINDLFNVFILKIKKNSTMERLFCHSDCETEDSVEAEEVEPHPRNRRQPQAKKSSRRTTLSEDLTQQAQLSAPNKRRKKRIAKPDPKKSPSPKGDRIPD